MPSSTDTSSPDLRRAAAFTLIELLTVVAIIGILAAILIPALNSVRKSARQAQCVASIHAFSGAFTAYMADHRNCMPDPDDGANQRWPYYVAPYIGAYSTTYGTNGRLSGLTNNTVNLYALPLFHDPIQPVSSANSGAGVFGYNVNLNHTYAFQGANSSTLNATPVKYVAIANPPTFPVLSTTEADVSGGIQLQSTGPAAPSKLATAQGWTGATNIRGPAPLFGPNAVFLFGDWHVALVNVCNANAWPWDKVNAFAVNNQ